MQIVMRWRNNSEERVSLNNKTSGLEPILAIWKHTILCYKFVYFVIIFMQLWWPI